MNEAKNAFISGIIYGWADTLSKSNYEGRFRVINDMKEFSEKLGKSAGVIISDDDNTGK